MYFRRLDFSGLESGPTQAVLPLVGLAADKVIRDRYYGRLDFSGLESGPTQAVLPLVGLAAGKVIRDRYNDFGDLDDG